MAKPEGITKKTKDNSRKHPHMREEWMAGKKLGRPKQIWVWDATPMEEIGETDIGHWEKIA